MGKKGGNQKSFNSSTTTNNDKDVNSSCGNGNGANIARSKKVKLLVKNPLFGVAVDDGDDGGDEYGEEDEESVVRARREALAALDPYNANAHKEHFKSLKAPKQKQQQRLEREDNAIDDDVVLTLLPSSPPGKKSTMTSNNIENPESLSTSATVSTPPTSRTLHQKRDSLRSSLYSTPKTQIIQRPLSRDMNRHHNQYDSTTTVVPEISISLATPSPPPSISSSGKHHHRRGSSLANANPALLTTTFTPSPLSVLSPLDEEFDRIEATKKDKSNRSTAIYTNLFQRITSFGSLGGSGKGAEDEVVDHIGAEMKKDSSASTFKPISTSWSLKRNTFGTSDGASLSNLSDTSSIQQQTSRFSLLGKKKKKGSKKSRKHGVATVMDSWDSCDDMLLQGTDDEELYDDGGNGSSPLDQFLKGRMGGRRRSSDGATTTVESEQGVIPRMGKGAMAGMEDWMMHPRTAAIRGTFHKVRRDAVPVPPAFASTATSENTKSQELGKACPVLSAAEYTTISLVSPPLNVYSSQALGGGQSANACADDNTASFSRTESLDMTFYRLKKGASNLLGSLGGSTSVQSNLSKGQNKKSQDQDEDARVRRMMNGDHGDAGAQGLVLDYQTGNDGRDGHENTGLSFKQQADQRSSSMTFGPRKAVSPPPLATFSSFPSLRDFIHSATGLSRSSTVPIGTGMGNMSPPPFSPTAYPRRSQTTTAAGFEEYADIQQSYSFSSSLTTGAESGRTSFTPVSRRKNTPAMVPTIVVPKHVPGSGASAVLLATPFSISPPLGSGSTYSSCTTTTLMTSSDEDDFLSTAAVASRSTPLARTFHRLGPSPPSSATVALTVPVKAATATNSTQLPSSLAAAAMAAAQRARTAYTQATSSSAPIITLNRSTTSVSVDSMTGPLTGNDYIGQFEKDRAQARNIGGTGMNGEPFGSMSRIDSYSSSMNSLVTTVNHPHHHQGSSSWLSYIPTTLSSTTTLPVSLDNGHVKDVDTTAGSGVGNNGVSIKSSVGFLRHLNNNEEENKIDTTSIRRTRQVSAQSDISEKLMHLPEPSPFEGMCSCRGLVNISSMLLILCGLILLILGYPIASSLKKDRLAAEAAAAAASAAVADGLTQVRFAMDSQHQQHQHGGVAGSGLLGLLSKTSASTVQKASSPRTAAMMVDPDTPEEKKMTVAKDGQPWDLVFSDEFNQDGRGFGLGQDPHWEAVDLAPSAAMGTLEHYSSDKVTTRNGQLEITLQRDPTSPSSAKVHKRDRGGSEWKYTSGMLQSWNKMCFQGGILEVAVSLPGIPSKAGLKPRVFILGNLARYGFPASMDGVWPFSTLSTPLQCDTSSPLAANSTAPSSSLAQRLNGCSSGAASLGGISRGAPEMTLLETHYGVQMDPAALEAQKREIQSQQIAQPAVLKKRQYTNIKRQIDQRPAQETVVLQKQSLGASRVTVDSNLGGRIGGGGSSPRQSIAMATVKVASSSSTASSGSSNSSTAVVETSTPQWVQPVDNRFFSSFSLSSSPLSNNKVQDEFVKVGLEYWPGSNSTNSNANDNDAYIQFSLNNQRQPPLLSHAHLQNHVSATSYSNNNDNWYKDAISLPSNTLIPQEPMSIVLSLGLLQDELLLDPELSYPAIMKIDYIRLYQPRQEQDAKEKGEMSGKRWLSCDPVDHPTAAYIRDHSRAYSDPGAGTWAEAGYV
ncbi:hypothetical protein BGX24_003135 [Mortierella sp. AD032]|nr:hypothetical protein BGX24_003135 [Mortierella sp. AD032]